MNGFPVLHRARAIVRAALLACLLVCIQVGCATSERQAARKLDLTPQIIRQGTDLLAADRELSRFPIVVDGFKGAMRLKGHVATAAQKARASRIIWTVPGVRSVENDLQVGGNRPGA